MKTPAGTLRTTACLLFVLLFSAALAACSGGGSTSTSSGGNASPAVGVSIASAQSYPAGTTFASSALSPASAAPPGNSPAFGNVFVTVTKIALIPSTGPESPDGNGELEMQNSSAEGDGGFVTATLSSPVVIDLLHPPTGREMADNVLNKFSEVPAGEYSKIRLYYDNVVGHTDGATDTLFHPTAHYHFDVHFVGGNLVIPMATDPQGIRFYSVVINVVGLKYHQAGNSGNVLLRPQVFATVEGSPKYIVHGVAEQVNHSSGTFNVFTAGNDNVHAAYIPNTQWFFRDGRFVGPFPSLGVSGVDALQNTATVDVIGTFQSGVLVAEEVDITFPDVLTGKVYIGWKGDNTFDLRPPVPAGDNTVFPMPARTTAYYDNAVDYGRLYDINISDNAAIIARGYKVPGGINAYWISIGP